MGKMFFHSTSFTGNALSCAAANASLQIWEDEPVMARIKAIEKSHQAQIVRFESQNNVAAVRQIGTIFALDVENEIDGYLSNLGPFLYDAFVAQDILLRPIGNCIYILPPYCVDAKDLEKIYDGVEAVLSNIRHTDIQAA